MNNLILNMILDGPYFPYVPNPSAAAPDPTVIYVIAGYTTTTTQITEEYDPDTWASKTNCPSPARTHTACFASTEVVYLVAGYDLSVGLQDCDAYDPDVWTGKTSMPTPGRENGGAFNIGDTGYYAGGLTRSPYTFTPITNVDGYDMGADSWSSKSAFSPSRYTAATFTLGDYGYSVAGYDFTVGRLLDNDQYAATDSWTAKTNIVSPSRYNTSGTDLAGKGYVIAGYVTGNIQDTDEYDPDGDSWASKTNCPAPARYAHVSSGADSSLYIIGGRTSSSLSDTDEYVVDTWTSKSNKTTAVQFPGGESL